MTGDRVDRVLVSFALATLATALIYGAWNALLPFWLYWEWPLWFSNIVPTGWFYVYDIALGYMVRFAPPLVGLLILVSLLLVPLLRRLFPENPRLVVYALVTGPAFTIFFLMNAPKFSIWRYPFTELSVALIGLLIGRIYLWIEDRYWRD